MQELRYAILFHDGIAQPHYDLLFEIESGSALAAWRSPVWPIADPTDIERLPDHRREYLDYEGPISGGRGHVRRVAGGQCAIERSAQDPARWTISGVAPAMRLILEQSAGRWVARTAPGG
jgi:hypothetical protein